VADNPVYVNIDLDVLDPSIFPATGTPEPGGMTFSEIESWLLEFRGKKVVGWDVVELAPHWDPSNVSSIVAAKVVRSLLGLTAIC
jgi:agmatinase